MHNNPLQNSQNGLAHLPTFVKEGFTLIELSIVLVIIGLIVGGILAGQDLISAASIRAQISQIEKYNAAVRAFQGKYGYLPGDIPDPTASSFGFKPRGVVQGTGGGNGLIQSGGASGDLPECGENGMVWVDLTTAALIGAGLTKNTVTCPIGSPTVDDVFPPAKIGNGNYVYVWSGGYSGAKNGNGINYFGVSSVTILGAGPIGTTGTSMTVNQVLHRQKSRRCLAAIRKRYYHVC